MIAMACAHPYTIKKDGLTACMTCEQFMTDDGTVVDPRTYRPNAKKPKPKRRFVRPDVIEEE